ncbi:glycosyltransferase, partial [Candidatus Altiarchaeota archaeon]
NYYTIGYYNPTKARVELDPEEPPEDIKTVFQELEKKEGIKCYYGRWSIEGKPKVILIDSQSMNGKIDGIKAGLWERYKVDSLMADSWFNDPLVWATAVGMLIEALVKKPTFKDKEVVAHFHEWLAGGAILYFKDKKLNIPTVLTTHATMLGRCMSGQDVDLYKLVNEELGKGKVADPELGKKYRCMEKHTMEMACANNASVLTTVSEITAKEAEYILGRKVDVVLHNGLDFSRYPDADELTISRRRNRKIMRGFLSAYFCRYYYMDFSNIRSMFISGRYEYHNKGIDLFIQSLGRLNDRLKKEKVDKNIVVFLFIPSGTKGENIEVLKNISLFEEMADRVDEEMPEIKEKILNEIIQGKVPEKFEEIVNEDFIKICKSIIVHFTSKKGGVPPLKAFDLSYPEETDPILKDLKNNNLFNHEEDKVKVIFYPAYLSTADRLIPLDYNEATSTCDVGVFPSYYEPWGYTPLESAALGSLAITTDLAGFGKFIEGKGEGIYVLKRENRDWEEVVKDLTEKLYEIVTLPRKELIHRRTNAKELSALADWKILAKNYLDAHDLAVEKAKSQ